MSAQDLKAAISAGIRDDGTVEDCVVETYARRLDYMVRGDGFLRVVADDGPTNVEVRIPDEALAEVGYTRHAAAELVAASAGAPAWKGYALLGTGQYVINHTPAPMDPELGAELIISIASEADKSGNRQIGEERDNDPNAGPILPEQMAVRIGFLSATALDALEAQLRHLRRENFPESAAPSTSGVLTDEQERANFDAWMREQYAPRPLTILRAMDAAVSAWEAWQARAAIEREVRASTPSPADQVMVLREALDDYLEAQDALDNSELAGPNAEPYGVLVRRRNAARKDLDAALSSALEATAPANHNEDAK